MKITLIVVAQIIFSTCLLSQGCLPNGITFSSQTQIDIFQTEFPDCTNIEGSVDIEGTNISNLSGLNIVTEIGGTLTIEGTENLVSLTGLDKLEFIGGSLAIGENAALNSLTGLGALAEVNENVWIFDNPNLINLNGVNVFSSIGEILSIYHNTNLSDISGLSSLNTIGGALFLDDNDKLESLSGLDNIDPASILDLLLLNNGLLSDCDVESICGYLENPGGTLEIVDNASGCNSTSEVASACDENSVEQFRASFTIEIFPNPVDDMVFIRAIPLYRIIKVSLYNHMAEKVYEGIPLKNKIDVSIHPEGIYIIEINFEHRVIREKLIIM